MPDRFEICIPFILAEEIGPFTATAGYVSAARAAQIGDSGGETVAGVARNKNADWAGWAIVDARKTEAGFPNNLCLDLPANAELKRLVGDVYRVKYWDLFRCGDLPPGLDMVLFDAAVQHLPKVAVRLIQLALHNVATDGSMGPATIAAAQQAERNAVLLRYFVVRMDLYVALITADSRKAANKEGWFSRLFRLHAFILTGELHG